MPDITFVDKDDVVIGKGTKREAWTKGIAHRIVRIFLFNSKGELLMQKRADRLASLPGKWDQSASGHVDAGEEYATAAQRELKEEVGVINVPLTERVKFFTDEKDEADKIKKRFNMLYTATYDGEIRPDAEEVAEVRWIRPEALEIWMAERPDDFTKGVLRSFQYLQGLRD